MSHDDAVAAALADALKTTPDGPIGVAVSGGGDSVALLCLMADWAAARGRRIHAATVDHDLRPESRAEAEAAGETARALGVSHDILTWQTPDGRGNLQDRARQARRALLAAWAHEKGLVAVALGHTQDDQAETVLLRLARGSGVDGLAAMQVARHADGLAWLRPLLPVRRAALRDVLRHRGLGWVEDPSNDDARFARIRLRRLMPDLAAEGMDAATLAATADRMHLAREVLNDAATALAEGAAHASPLGYVRLNTDIWAKGRCDTRRRVLARALGWVGGQTYRPRLADLVRIEDALVAGDRTARTLQGCILRPDGAVVTICRELAATGPEVPAGSLWDGRWHSVGPADCTIRALGESGLSQCENWRSSGHPRDAVLASPAIWCGETVRATAWGTDGAEIGLKLATDPQLCFTKW